MFDQNEALRVGALKDCAEVSACDTAGRLGAKGIAAYRDRRVVSWLPLSYGNFGSAFDEEDVKNRLLASLVLDADTELHNEGEVTLAVSVEPITMSMVGQAGEIVSRCPGTRVVDKLIGP